MSTDQEYTLDNIIGELSDLQELLDSVSESLTDMGYGVGDEKNRELDRVASLIAIAGRVSRQILKSTRGNYQSLETGGAA